MIDYADASPQYLVAKFHRAFGVVIRDEPIANPPESDLRTKLLREEVEEYYDAVRDNDVIGVAQELADIVYVAYGAALTHGIDLDAVIAEVHRANMSKLDDDGKPLVREDGKILKSKNFVPPDVAQVLLEQQHLSTNHAYA